MQVERFGFLESKPLSAGVLGSLAMVCSVSPLGELDPDAGRMLADVTEVRSVL